MAAALLVACPLRRRVADQVAVLVGVPVNERLYEGALRDDGLPGGTDVVERLSHQLAPEALTLVLRQDLGVDEGHDALASEVFGESGELAVNANLVPMFLRCVSDSNGHPVDRATRDRMRHQS